MRRIWIGGCVVQSDNKSSTTAVAAVAVAYGSPSRIHVKWFGVEISIKIIVNLLAFLKNDGWFLLYTVLAKCVCAREGERVGPSMSKIIFQKFSRTCWCAVRRLCTFIHVPRFHHFVEGKTREKIQTENFLKRMRKTHIRSGRWKEHIFFGNPGREWKR